MGFMRGLVRLFWGLHVVIIIPTLIFILRYRGPPEPIKTRGFVVDTPACRIPDIDPFDRSIARYIRRTGYKLICRKVPSITFEEGDTIRINWAAINSSYRGKFEFCKYQPIYRQPDHSDFHYTYGNLSKPFSQDIKIKDEFVRIHCYSKQNNIIYRNFHAMIISNSKKEKRCDEQLQRHLLKTKPKETMNVLMIGLDSLSRLNFIRQMPLTRKFLLDDLNGIEMLGYTKVADNTFLNVVPLTTGKFAEELPWNESMRRQPFDNYTFIWKNFSRNGYRTLYSEDAPYTSAFTYLKAGFYQPPADHYMRVFSIALEAATYIWNSDHMCVGDRSETDIVLKYIRDFAARYRNKPHFGFTFLTRLTHDDVNTAELADVPHVQFLQRIHSEGLLANTVLVYFSDHGIRFGRMRRTFIGKLEERMPLLTIMLPRWFKKKYPKLYENMKTNAQRLSSPFDVYETLRDILNFSGKVRTANFTSRGISLFNEIPRDRSCDKAAVLPHWCMCLENKEVSISAHQVLEAAHLIVQHINTNMFPYRKLCHMLEINKIHKAVEMVANDNVLRFGNSINDVINRTVNYGRRTNAVALIQVTIETVPGGAMFEATASFDETNQVFSLAGDISRINKYGGQSNCINNFKLKKYCFCK